jgi:WD40 repeat protein
LPAHRTEPTAAAFSPDGNCCLTGESSGRVNLFRVDDGKLLWSELRHSRKIAAVAFTADGKQLLTASLDNTVGRWDVATGRELPPLVWKHPSGVVGLTLLGSDRAATACEDGLVRLWRIADDSPMPETLPLPKGNYAATSASADGRLLIVVDRDLGRVRIWDVVAGNERAPADKRRHAGAWLDLGAGGAVWTAVFAPDGATFVTVGGNEVRQWSLTDGAELQMFRPHGSLAGVAFSPDGRSAATAGWDGAVKVWNLADARAVKKLRAHGGGNVNDVVFRGDGRILLTAGDDRTARLWDVATEQEIRTLAGHADRVLRAAFSLDGRRVVTASADKTARIWDADDGRLLHELTGHAWPVLAAEFSPDGHWVVTAGADDVATLWNADTGKSIRSFTGHTAAVTSASFSPDARRIVTGSRDANVKVWDALTGKELLTLKGHADEVTVAKFSASGRSILTAGADGAAILWPAVEWQATPEGPQTKRAMSAAAVP